MLLFCLTTKTYLSPQLLVYMPIDLPVHYPTCSFWLFHSDKPFVLTCPLTYCSKYSQIYIFINQPVQFVCVFHLALNAHLSVNTPAGLRTDRPTQKWMYVLILMLLDITTKTYLASQLFMCPYMHPIKSSPRLVLCIHSDLPSRSTRPPNYCSTYIQIYPEMNLLLYHDTFLPANHEDLPVD